MLGQIESAMTPDQLQFIASLQLTQNDMQVWANANGITMGSGGGTPGQGSGMSPEARATKQAEEGITSSNGSGSKLSAALLDAAIFSLVEQLP